MYSIKTIEKSNCYVCGAKGEFLYGNLTDKLFNAPGQWNFFRCKNKDCNLIWLNPMPIEEDISAAYKNYYTHTDESNNSTTLKKLYKIIQAEYLSSKYGYNDVKNSLLKNILYLDPDRLEQTKYEVMYLENTKGKLLDIGCGSGTFIDFMNKYGWETTGIDFDDKAIEAARAKNLNVKLGTLVEQNFSNDYFDAITLAHVIEHVYDPIELLTECYRILKTNGKIVIAIPNSESLGHKYFKKNWRGLEPPRHIHVFSPKSLIHIVKLSGFKKFDSFTTNRIARYIYRASKESSESSAVLNEASSFIKLKARLFSLLEWILIKLEYKCGEEVILIAEK